MHITIKYIIASLVLGVFLVCSGRLFAQTAPAPESPVTPDGREALHLTTIGTYSAGFVLQSYGYIGVLADVLSQKVYEPEMVRSMLGETTTFLKNCRQQLALYQDDNIQISPGDQQFIDGISEIIRNLIREAEALSSFAQTYKDEDLAKFEEARKEAWGGIKKTLGVN